MTGGGLIIAAPSSGSGKTTITAGVLRAFRKRGVRVAAAKAGPDYIDPGFHLAAGAALSVNLDPWAMRPATLAALLERVGTAAELVVCEGVMGLYDGVDAAGTGSTAALAALTGWPVVLIVDARGSAASAAALAHGFVHPPPALARAGLSFAGVAFNRIGSAAHLHILRDAMRANMPDLPVLGGLPAAPGIKWPERHLGLVPAGEQPELERAIARAAELIEAGLDLEALRQTARPARRAPAGDTAGDSLPPLGQRIAVARDDAFVFAYPWVLDGWRRAGAELTFFSPLLDEAPATNADAIYLPGGYPELHAGRLAASRTMLAALRRAAADRVTIYGECGGYMTLGAGLIDASGKRHAMAGLLPLVTSFAERKLHLGYREATLVSAGPLGRTGQGFRGHEFHYATVVDEGPGEPLFATATATGHRLATTGLRSGTVLGSFVHLIDRVAANV
ncbi:MAG TPA: cobyrinate a,c-diamide synthase [Alphaproteobacteria bacterium]|nr:cobyrinate a,c-diamide synthase [Alphaproteobacteria bacterium]